MAMKEPASQIVLVLGEHDLAIPPLVDLGWV